MSSSFLINDFWLTMRYDYSPQNNYIYLINVGLYNLWLSQQFLNILVARNRKSGYLEIGVPALGKHLFCTWALVHFYGDVSQGPAASAVRSSLYQCLNRNYDSVCTKSGYKKWFPYHRTADVKPSGIFTIIEKCTDSRFLGVFGEKKVNVLKVNLMLDGIL